ncbi:MAG: flippase-like domain-containing protein [Alkalispirochaetaceae bacterium]
MSESFDQEKTALDVRALLRRFIWVLPVTAAVSVGFTLVTTDAEQLLQLRSFALPFLAAAAILRLVPWVTKTLRLHNWLRFRGHPMSLGEAFHLTVISELGSLISPTVVGGEPIKAGMLYARGISLGESTSLTTVEAVENITLYTIGAPILLFFVSRRVFRSLGADLSARAEGGAAALSGIWPYLLVAVMASALGAVLLIARRKGVLTRLAVKLRLFGRDFLTLYREMLRAGKLRFAGNLLLATVHWAARYSVVTALAFSLGYRVDPLTVILLQWILFGVMMVVPTPGASGGAEAAFLILFSGTIPAEAIGTILIGWRFVDYYLVSVVALAVVSIAGLTAETQSGKPRSHGAVGRLWIITRLFWKYRQFHKAVFWSLLGPPMFLLTRVTLALDHLFFPKLRKVRIDRPVFILGHPRSGTTFLQKQIFGSHTAGMFTTWELFVPSLTLRKIVRPFIRFLNRFFLDVVQPAEQGHEVRLNGVEEDEGLFMHRLDTEILTFNCPWILTDPKYRDLGLYLGRYGRGEQRRSVKFYRKALKRQILATGHRRMVLKSNPSVFRLREIFELFPDARVVYVVRSPEESIRSHLEFSKGFVEPRLTPEEQKIYIQQKYRWSVDLYTEFERLRPRIPESQVMVLPFSEIKERLPEALATVLRFAELEPGEKFWRDFESRPDRRHRKRHQNRPLRSFGLSPERVRQDVPFVWRRYLGERRTRDGELPAVEG